MLTLYFLPSITNGLQAPISMSSALSTHNYVTNQWMVALYMKLFFNPPIDAKHKLQGWTNH